MAISNFMDHCITYDQDNNTYVIKFQDETIHTMPGSVDIFEIHSWIYHHILCYVVEHAAEHNRRTGT